LRGIVLLKQQEERTSISERIRKMATEMVKCESAKVPGVSVEVPFDFGANLEDAKTKHGESAVFANYRKGATIEVQNVGRRLLIAGKPPAEIATVVSGHKLGTSMRLPTDPKAAAMAALTGMTPEERKAFLRELQQMASAKGLS
jgi:hypothetical protein